MENRKKNIENILKLKGTSDEIDNYLEVFVNKNKELDDVDMLIKKCVLKDKIRLVSNFLLYGLLGISLVFPNVFMYAISFGILKLFMSKYLGIKRSNQQCLKMLLLKRSNFEIEIYNLTNEIVDLNDKMLSKELFAGKDFVTLFDEERDNKIEGIYSFSKDSVSALSFNGLNVDSANNKVLKKRKREK